MVQVILIKKSYSGSVHQNINGQNFKKNVSIHPSPTSPFLFSIPCPFIFFQSEHYLHSNRLLQPVVSIATEKRKRGGGARRRVLNHYSEAKIHCVWLLS